VNTNRNVPVPKWENDQSCDKEHDGKDSKDDVAQLVVLAVLGQLCKLLHNSTI